MRMLGAIVIALLCAIGAAAPAQALEFCDKIKEPQQRMACLQEHISHLEESLLGLSTQLTDLRNALKQKLDAESVFKWQFMANAECLGYSDAEKDLVMQSCDHPDSWKLLPGRQKPVKQKAKPKNE